MCFLYLQIYACRVVFNSLKKNILLIFLKRVVLSVFSSPIFLMPSEQISHFPACSCIHPIQQNKGSDNSSVPSTCDTASWKLRCSVSSLSVQRCINKVERVQQRSNRTAWGLKHMPWGKVRAAQFNLRKRRLKCKLIAVSIKREVTGKMQTDAYVFLWFSMFYTYTISKEFKSRTFFPELVHRLYWYTGISFITVFLYKKWFDINHNCLEPFHSEKNNIMW